MTNNKLYDVIIIGGAPAGTAAAVYCARKQLQTLLITEKFGGQSVVSNDIQNWIGELHISGLDLAKKFEKHARAYENVVDIKYPEKVGEVEEVGCSEKDSHRTCDYKVTTDKASYIGKVLIVGSGARRRRLGVPGEDEYEGKGVAYCSTCDAPLFKDRVVGVVGGGNSGLEAVMDLDAYAKKIILFERGDELRGDKVTQEKVKNIQKAEIVTNAEAVEVIGDKMITGFKYKDLKNGEEKQIELGGLFVEIGSIPNSEIVKGLVDINSHGEIIIDCKFASTSNKGIFAAGDVTDDPYKQNNISAGDGVRAALSAYQYIQNLEKISPAAEK